jgi:hypothetical protein
MIKITSLLTLFVMAAILVSMNTSISYAQNNALSQSGNSKAEQAIEQAQSSSQDSQCVSGDITALSCNNLGLQVQRNGDGDGEEPNPPNPNPGDRCPEGYVYDVTVDGPATNMGPGVPRGTVICLFEDKIGDNKDAFVNPGQGQQGFTSDVIVNQPNESPNCNGAGQQPAHVSSGTPPSPQLEMNDPVCVTVKDIPSRT